MPHASPPSLAWRGCASFITYRSGWGRDRSGSSWPWGWFRMEGDHFSIQDWRTCMSFTANELESLEAHERPLPGLIAVVKLENGYRLGKFTVLRKSRLEEILSRTGLEPVRRRWLRAAPYPHI